MAESQGLEQSLTVSERPEYDSESNSERSPTTRIVPPDDPVAAFTNVDQNNDGQLDMIEVIKKMYAE